LAFDDGDSEKNFFITDSLMSLFFIEAFQAGNYWDLLHRFLASPTLQEISDVEITVLEDGFVPYSGGSPSFDDDWYKPPRLRSSASNDTMTPGMVIGIAFATLFCIGLIAIWVYLCFMVPGTFLYNARRRKPEAHYKDGSVTDDACTNDSIDFTPEEESAWLDAWAQSVTSIPLREPSGIQKKKKKRGQPTKQSFVRPAHEHCPSLDCIDESDNESCASSVASTKTTATNRTTKSSIKEQKNRSMVDYLSSSPFLQQGAFGTIAEQNDMILDPPGKNTSDADEDRKERLDGNHIEYQLSEPTTEWTEESPSVSSLNVQLRLSL
jgi:hypothetical protein